MIYVFVFIFGAIIGSFLNVVSLRYNTGQSIVFRPSYCFSCGKKLFWLELIPIFSFIFQKGKCRKCGSKISRQYPLVEITTGLLFLLIFNFQFSIFNEFPIINYQFLNNLALTVYYWFIFSLLIVVSVYDFRHQIIPDGLVYTFIILSLFSIFIENWSLRIENFDVLTRFLAGLALFLFFGILWLLSRGKWMGLGDAKLALGIGWFLGLSRGIMAILFSFWLGALISVFLLLFRPKNFTMKSRIPFGPFLCLGTFLTFLLGSAFLKLYWFF